MKRLFLSFALTTLFLIPSQSKDGDQMTLQSGTASVIWTLHSAYFETDWSTATIEGVAWDQWLESKGPDYVRDWPSDKAKIENFFMERFNKKTAKKKGLNLQNSNPNDTYYFIIHPQDVDMGSIGGGVVASAFLGSFARKSGGVNFKSGYLDIIETATGKIVCRLSFKDVRGDSGLNMTTQLLFVFDDMKDEIIGFATRFHSQSRPEIYAEASTVAPHQQPAKDTYQTALMPTTSQPQANVIQPTSATQQQVAVKLKNGATIKGEMKSIDPLGNVVLIIAGKETTIPMEKVENVEMTQAPVPVQAQTTNAPTRQPIVQTGVSPTNGDHQLGNQKIIVTEKENYPDKITINLGNMPVEMALVKGGRMNMGFDGDHSLAMKSEPVHEVEVTSFYISTKPLSYLAVTSFGNTKHDDMGSAIVEKYKDVESIINAINKETGKLFRLPTEAEWEYAACSELQNQLFADVVNQKKIAYDWCSDYYDEFKTGDVVTDPTGPMSGDNRVVRAYNNKYGKLNRNNKLSVGRYILGYIRLVIKAKDATK